MHKRALALLALGACAPATVQHVDPLPLVISARDRGDSTTLTFRANADSMAYFHNDARLSVLRDGQQTTLRTTLPGNIEHDEDFPRVLRNASSDSLIVYGAVPRTMRFADTRLLADGDVGVGAVNVSIAAPVGQEPVALHVRSPGADSLGVVCRTFTSRSQYGDLTVQLDRSCLFDTLPPPLGRVDDVPGLGRVRFDRAVVDLPIIRYGQSVDTAYFSTPVRAYVSSDRTLSLSTYSTRGWHVHSIRGQHRDKLVDETIGALTSTTRLEFSSPRWRAYAEYERGPDTRAALDVERRFGQLSDDDLGFSAGLHAEAYSQSWLSGLSGPLARRSDRGLLTAGTGLHLKGISLRSGVGVWLGREHMPAVSTRLDLNGALLRFPIPVTFLVEDLRGFEGDFLPKHAESYQRLEFGWSVGSLIGVENIAVIGGVVMSRARHQIHGVAYEIANQNQYVGIGVHLER